ncbi:hypothetical protein [Plantibacter sp. YIM 135347]|uniref:hypothetical protein n=1 Tax=Plantibacter sp. YIM 135347 TaxID=3423919 RepID=UPI003D34389D
MHNTPAGAEQFGPLDPREPGDPVEPGDPREPGDPLDQADAAESIDPAAMLALSERQARRVDDLFFRPTVTIVFIWGVAWFVGFLVLWSASSGNPWFRTPVVPAGIVFAALMIGGVVSSAIIGSRTGHGIQGPQQVQGAMYGFGWAIGSTAAAVFGGAMFVNGMSGELAAIFYPAVYSLVVGLLYLAGGAIWQDRTMYAVGVWIVVVGVVAPYFGQPLNELVMALAGGGGFLVYGVILVLARKRRVPGTVRGSGSGHRPRQARA